jgi:hypothetical protein
VPAWFGVPAAVRSSRRGAAWDLDHTPDRIGYLGPSHMECNRVAVSRVGGAGCRGDGEAVRA